MHAAPGSTTFQYSRLRGLEQIGLDATDKSESDSDATRVLTYSSRLGSDITQGKIHLPGESGGYTQCFQLQHRVRVYLYNGWT